MDYVYAFIASYCLIFAIAMGIGMFLLFRSEKSLEDEYEAKRRERKERQAANYFEYYHFENGNTITTDYTRLN